MRVFAFKKLRPRQIQCQSVHRMTLWIPHASKLHFANGGGGRENYESFPTGCKREGKKANPVILYRQTIACRASKKDRSAEGFWEEKQYHILTPVKLTLNIIIKIVKC